MFRITPATPFQAASACNLPEDTRRTKVLRKNYHGKSQAIQADFLNAWSIRLILISMATFFIGGPLLILSLNCVSLTAALAARRAEKSLKNLVITGVAAFHVFFWGILSAMTIAYAIYCG